MGLMLEAGAAGFATLFVVLLLGRRIESSGGRRLLLLLALVLATTASLCVLHFVGGLSLDPTTAPADEGPIVLPPLGAPGGS